MSTKCIIGYMEKAGNIVASEVEHDGYITDGVGDVLRNYYSAPEDAKWIVSLGDRDYIATQEAATNISKFKNLEDFECQYSTRDDLAFIFLYKEKAWYFRPWHVKETDWSKL